MQYMCSSFFKSLFLNMTILTVDNLRLRFILLLTSLFQFADFWD